MPSSKRRDFDDTWKKEELENSIKGAKDDRRRSKEKDRDKGKERDRRRDDEERHKRRGDDEKRERSHRDTKNGDVDSREKHRSSRHRDETDGDRSKHHRRPKEGEDDDRERRHRRPRDDNDDDSERRHRRHRDDNDDDGEREKRHRRHRDENDEDRERGHRRHRDENDLDEDRERRHRRHRDDNENNDSADRHERRRRHRDRDENEDKYDADKKSKKRDETEEERRKRKEKEREKRHRDENGERPRKHRDDERKDDDKRHRKRDDDEEERRRRHEERKKERDREKERQKEKEREEENERQRQRQKEREKEHQKEKGKRREHHERSKKGNMNVQNHSKLPRKEFVDKKNSNSRNETISVFSKEVNKKGSKDSNETISLSSKSSSSKITKEYLQFLEENYLIDDDFESDDSELVACGASDSAQDLEPKLYDQINMKDVYGNANNKDSVSSVTQLGQIRDKILNETYNVYSDYERYPCDTPVPHNSKTSMEDKESSLSTNNIHPSDKETSLNLTESTGNQQSKTFGAIFPPKTLTPPARPTKESLEEIRKSLDEMEQELLNSKMKAQLDQYENTSDNSANEISTETQFPLDQYVGAKFTNIDIINNHINTAIESDNEFEESPFSPRSIVTELATARSEVMIDVMTPVTERSEDQVDDLEMDDVHSPRDVDFTIKGSHEDLYKTNTDDIDTELPNSHLYNINKGTVCDNKDILAHNEEEDLPIAKISVDSCPDKSTETKTSCSSMIEESTVKKPNSIHKVKADNKITPSYSNDKHNSLSNKENTSAYSNKSSKELQSSQQQTSIEKTKQFSSRVTKEKKPYIPVGGISKNNRPMAVDPRTLPQKVTSSKYQSKDPAKSEGQKEIDVKFTQIGKKNVTNITRPNSYGRSNRVEATTGRQNSYPLTQTDQSSIKNTLDRQSSSGRPKHVSTKKEQISARSSDPKASMYKSNASNVQNKSIIKPLSRGKIENKDISKQMPVSQIGEHNSVNRNQRKRENERNSGRISNKIKTGSAKTQRNSSPANKTSESSTTSNIDTKRTKISGKTSNGRTLINNQRTQNQSRSISYDRARNRSQPPNKTSQKPAKQIVNNTKNSNRRNQEVKQKNRTQSPNIATNPYNKKIPTKALKTFTPQQKSPGDVNDNTNRETPMMQDTFKEVYSQQVSPRSHTKEQVLTNTGYEQDTTKCLSDNNICGYYSSDFTSCTSTEQMVSGTSDGYSRGDSSSLVSCHHREETKDEPEEEAADDDGGDDYNYEEDFEDYDDDFEDDDGEEDEEEKSVKADDSEDDNSEPHSKGYYTSLDWDPKKASRNEVDDVLQAMNDENERLARDAKQMQQQSQYDSYDDDEDYNRSNYRSRPKTAQRTFINFVSAKQREISGKAASKTMRRAKELRELIELDVARFDIFDMPPVNEYELYMRSFGGSNTKQAYVQTNEDNIDRDIQTEEIETREIWVQNTPDAIENVGGPDFEKKEDEFAQASPQESARRALLWERALNATLILLEEDAAEKIQANTESRKQSNMCLSEAFQELETESFSLLKDRAVICSHFSSVQTHMLLTVHKSKYNDTSRDIYSNKGIICVWNVNSPHSPQKVLLCESQPRCCCFSPNKATLAFAGMRDGSILVWDLREASSMHKQYTDGKSELVLRYPTYSTAGVLQYENHQSAIIAIHPILTPVTSGGASELDNPSEDGEGLSFQIATLEHHSVINLWVVAEIGHPDPAGSESDLGLSPGGRVKLIKSSTIQLESPLRDARLRTTMLAFDMKMLPSNNSHFYVATDTGCVIHGVRYGGKAPPKAHQGEIESPVKITTIDFSPFPEPVFLAGCEDGTLRLHHTDSEYPLITWPDATGGAAIKVVRWCRSRPSVFFVLDDQSRMHIWDLLMSDAVPMKFEQIAEERVNSIDLSNDHSATGIGLPRRKPQMVISLESGATEVHTLSREFSALMADELDQFSRLIQRIT